MNEYLIRTSNPNPYYEANYYSVIRAGMLNNDTILNILHIENPVQPGDVLIGAWNPEGNKVEALDIDSYKSIRPLGNEPSYTIYDDNDNPVRQTRGGNATKFLGYHHFAGWKARKLGDESSSDLLEQLYPLGDIPFGIEIRHKQWTGQPNPSWDGWGWRAEILGGAASRDPSARAIGVYNDAECTQYLYTTGAFIQGQSEWQTDADGNPLTVWFTETPVGYATEHKEDHHLACLFGSAQEGYQTLRSTENSVLYLFWERTQNEIPSGDWVDTGAVVTGQSGQLYYISDASVVANLVPGEDIKLGDQETTFVKVWPGTDDLIEIDPFVTAQVGDSLWVRS